MNALVDLKTWYSLEDTAKRLADTFDAEITVKDVLQFGIGSHLRLSWNAVNKFACRVAPFCKLIDTVGAECWPQWDQFEGAVIWSGGYAHRTSKGLQAREEFASLKCIPVDESPRKFVTGVFRFHPEYHHTYAWISSFLNCADLAEGPGSGWDLTSGVCLSDEFGQMWDFLDPSALVRRKGDSWDEISRRMDRLADLPRFSGIVVQRSDIEAFEGRFLLAESKRHGEAKQQSGSELRRDKTLLRIIALMLHHRYSGNIGEPYTIARLLLDKATELGVKISDDSIAKHIKVALELVGAR